jgi:uncharacterized repeat protein (TIGR01451 family)
VKFIVFYYLNQLNKEVVMKHKLKFALSLGFAVLLILAIPMSVYAIGTPAGMVIKNVVKLNYKDSNNQSFPEIQDSISVVVEQVAAVDLSPNGYRKTSADDMYITFAVTLTNQGNGTDAFPLTYVSEHSWTPQIYYDADGDGVLDQSEIDAGTISTTPNIAADGTYKFIVRLFVPRPTASGTMDTSLVAATSNFDGNVKDYQHDTVDVKATSFSPNKTADRTVAKPGDEITYTISYTNTGTGTALTASVTDSLPAYVTYVSASEVVSPGSVSVASNVVTWTIGSIAAGASGTLSFRVTVNDGVAEGTIINNNAGMAYTDSISGKPYRPQTPTPPITVIKKRSWSIEVRPTLGPINYGLDSANVGETLSFLIILKNNANGLDTAVNHNRTTSRSWDWSVYKDDGDATYESGTDGSYALNDEVIVASGDSVMFFARYLLPTLTTDRTRDTATYEFQSKSGTENATGWTYSLVKAPLMSISKSVSSTGNRTRPGDTLVYTITYTNNGSGVASSVVISDASPTNTSYLSNSVEVNNSSNGNVFTGKTDDSGDDEVTVSSGNVTVNLGTVGGKFVGAATYTGQIRFKVKID